MALSDLLILGLMATAAVFSVIELGLTADGVNSLQGYNGYYYGDLGARVDFLLFVSVWTLVVVALLFIFPVVFKSRTGSVSWAGPFTLAINAITMIFWLAGFAAWADLYHGFTSYITGISAAILAFAILLWIIFLALTIINFLTAFSVMKSERFGYAPLSRKTTVP